MVIALTSLVVVGRVRFAVLNYDGNQATQVTLNTFMSSNAIRFVYLIAGDITISEWL